MSEMLHQQHQHHRRQGSTAPAPGSHSFGSQSLFDSPASTFDHMIDSFFRDPIFSTLGSHADDLFEDQCCDSGAPCAITHQGQTQESHGDGQLTQTQSQGSTGGHQMTRRGQHGLSSLMRSPNMTRIPAMQIMNKKGSTVFKFEVPGIKKEDLKVSLDGQMLNVCGKTCKEYEDAETGQKSSSQTTFRRSVRIPTDTFQEKDISANYEDGCLRIEILKKPEAEKKAPKKITNIAIE